MMGEGGAGASTASSSGNGGNGGEGEGNGEERIARRKPSWRERENNRRRERRRRAVSAKIYAGLRAQGNYTLPKHCDNNEVLKALCAEAGWIVEPDGTTYRKGCRMEMGGNSANITPSSSRNGSPPPSSYFAIPSYQPSPSLSRSPSSSSFLHSHNNYHYQFPFRISNSAPVTPPLSSPSRIPLPLDLVQQSMSALNVPFFAASAPASPRRFKPPTIPECDESHIDSGPWTRFQAYINASNDAAPTFNVGKTSVERAIMLDKGKGAVKAWEGEMIHEVGMEDEDLELTLGSSSSSAKFKH